MAAPPTLGAPAPQFDLMDGARRSVTLADCLGAGHVLLYFVRGFS